MENVKYRCMRIVLVILGVCLTGSISQAQTLGSLHFSKGLDQKDELTVEEGMDLEQALGHVEKRFNVVFLYRTDALKDKKVFRASFSSPNNLEKTMQKLLQGQNLAFKYLNPKTYGIFTTEETPKKKKVAAVEHISGTVMDAQSGETLPGVNILVKGTTTGASTDQKGQYELIVSSLQDTLIFTYIGYQRQEVAINGRTEIDVALQPQAIAGEELVVVGYGTQRRQDLTGSVSTVHGENLENLAVSRIDEAIQGRISGVNVVQNSGVPGGNISIRVRGTNSINASSDPLFVVDGVPGAGNLNTIAPENVESIEVLKDASATAIYGARGAGGVIMITTKKGIRGDVQVSFDASYSTQKVAKKLDLLNATEFAELKNEAYTNDGLEPVYSNPSSFSEGTDWQDRIFRSAPQQKYNLSVSGGSKNITYRISGNYLDQEGTLINSFFNRGGLRLNLDGDLGDKVTFGTTLSLSKQDRNGVGGQRVRNALLFNPILPVKDDQGNYTRFNVPQVDVDNPVAEAKEPSITNEEFRTFGNVFATFALLENLELRVSLGGEIANSQNKQYIPTEVLEGLRVGGQANINTGTDTKWVSENTLTYENTFNDVHDLTVLGGYTVQKNRFESIYTGAEQFVTDRLGYKDLSSGSIYLAPDTGVEEWALQSYLFRTNYILQDKYLFTLTGRYDGSSRFGEGNRYGFFPSGSFAWRVSNEDFFDIKAVDDLKIRISYGLTGNQNIGNFPALATMGTENYPLGESSTMQIGLGPDRIANPDLKWENTAQFDLGIDLSLYNSRLSITADYYYKKTDDLLLEVSIPSQTGFSSFLDNVGSVKNSGFELSLESVNISQGDFAWNSSFNITANNNEVLDLGDKESFFPNLTLGQSTQIDIETLIVQEGHPLGTFYGYTYDGVFRNQEELSQGEQPDAEVGYPRFVDTNGDGIFTSADKTIIGSGQPDFYGGITNSFFYKGFQVRLHLQGSYGGDVLNSTRIALESLSGGTNNLSTVKDRWTPENRDTDVPKAIAGGYPLRVSTRYIEDGSYLRVKNLTLSYNLSEKFLERSPISNARIYLTGTNIYTLTGYSGYDPGLNFQGGSNVAFSVDYNPYPTSRIYTLGVSLEF